MNGRVLVVEDDHATQLLLEAVLARESIAAELAGDGQTALQKMDGGDFDAILLDLLMPRVDGFTVLRTTHHDHPHLMRRIIVVTAAADSLWSGCAELDHVHALLRKPLDIEILLAQIRRCLYNSIAINELSRSSRPAG